MPKKSRRIRRHSAYRKVKGSETISAAVPHEPAVGHPGQPLAADVAQSPVSNPADKIISKYSFIRSDLVKIGILTGVILIILTVLSFLLH